MTYKNKLNPWCIIRPVSSVQMRIVGSFAAELTQKASANLETTDAKGSPKLKLLRF